MDKISKSTMIDICNRGIENRYNLIGDEKTRGWKIFVYHIAVIILSPKAGTSEVKRFYFINGRSQSRQNLEISDSFKIYHGKVYSSLKDLLSLSTLYCNDLRLIRGIKFLKWNISFLLSCKKIQNYSMWIEFCSLCNFLKNISNKTVCGRGHYDEYSTWIGELSRVYCYRYEIYQHGVLYSGQNITHKIVCDTIHAFDNYSIGVFRERIIANANCSYQIYEFPSSVVFNRIPEKRNDVLYVGIAEQGNREWMDEVINALERIKNVYIIVMKHPLSNENYNVVNGEVESKIKYLDVDYLITEHSTIAIDYYRAKSKATIIYTAAEMKKAFSDYPFVFVDSIDSIPEIMTSNVFKKLSV